MNKSERIVFIIKELNKLYPKTPTPLKHTNIYELLIAVLLSAQCTDERVNKITPSLFKKANSSKKMLDLTINQIYKMPSQHYRDQTLDKFSLDTMVNQVLDVYNRVLKESPTCMMKK